MTERLLCSAVERQMGPSSREFAKSLVSSKFMCLLLALESTQGVASPLAWHRVWCRKWAPPSPVFYPDACLRSDIISGNVPLLRVQGAIGQKPSR